MKVYAACKKKWDVVILKQEWVATGNQAVIQVACQQVVLSLLHAGWVTLDQVKIRFYVLKINFGILR